ncbi:MAG: peptidyl-prolyl cis-trans isomerase [Proteobacteria bacterium]|nr:peptidyl-prolyl cis-trans isomerase [Pseudomonadota bacterium]
MLEALRQGVQSWYFKGLLIILISSFAVWGVGDIFRGGPTGGSVITVGGRDIDPSELYNSFRLRLSQISRRLGNDISIEQAQQLGLVDQTVEALTTEALYEVEAAELGVVISDAALIRQIREQKAFQDSLGQFDRARFERVITANGMTEAGFVNQLRWEFIRDQILRSLAGSLPESRELAQVLFDWRQERRIADYIVLKNDPTVEIATPDDAVLQTYYTDNAARFTAPAYRKIAFVHLTTADARADITIPDDQLRQAYENRIDAYRQPDRRTVQQIILPDEAAAKNVVAKLAEGREFVALAEEVAQQDPGTTNLGDVTAGQLPAGMSEAVFALGKGETSAPIEGPFGWYVIRVTDIKPESTMPLAEVADSLRQELAKDKAVDVLFSLSNALEDTLGSGATLEEAAAKIGVPSVTIDAVDANGRGPDGSPVPAIPPGSDLATHAFATPVGEESALIETGNGGYLVVRVDSEQPSAVRPFETVRNEAIAGWKAEQRALAEEKRAEAVTARLNEGATLAAIAAEFNLGEPVTSPAFTRDGADAGAEISRALAADLFARKPGGAAFGNSAEGYTIAVLKTVKPADPVAEKAAYDAFNERIATDLSSDIVVQYANALRERYPVEIDQRAIDNLFLRN